MAIFFIYVLVFWMIILAGILLDETAGWSVLALPVAVLLTIIAYSCTKEIGYKQGQEDALKGQYKYKLVEYQTAEPIDDSKLVE